MEAQLQCVEVEFIVLDDDNLPIENAAGRQRRAQWLQQVGEVAVEGLFVAALDQDLVSVAKDQRTKSVPLGLEDVIFPSGQFIHALGKHGQERRVHWKVHASWYTVRSVLGFGLAEIFVADSESNNLTG